MRTPLVKRIIFGFLITAILFKILLLFPSANSGNTDCSTRDVFWKSLDKRVLKGVVVSVSDSQPPGWGTVTLNIKEKDLHLTKSDYARTYLDNRKLLGKLPEVGVTGYPEFPVEVLFKDRIGEDYYIFAEDAFKGNWKATDCQKISEVNKTDELKIIIGSRLPDYLNYLIVGLFFLSVFVLVKKTSEK